MTQGRDRLVYSNGNWRAHANGQVGNFIDYDSALAFFHKNKKVYPKVLNIGCGRSYVPEAWNIDISPAVKSDAVLDISCPDLCFPKGHFERIIAHEVLEHVRDLVGTMTNCRDLLAEDGIMDIIVPYDLSLVAWQDPTHVRAMNENSWIYYNEWSDYIGWKDWVLRSEVVEFIYSQYGEMLAGQGMAPHEVARQARAVDYLHVVLRKVRR